MSVSTRVSSSTVLSDSIHSVSTGPSMRIQRSVSGGAVQARRMSDARMPSRHSPSLVKRPNISAVLMDLGFMTDSSTGSAPFTPAALSAVSVEASTRQAVLLPV